MSGLEDRDLEKKDMTTGRGKQNLLKILGTVLCMRRKKSTALTDVHPRLKLDRSRQTWEFRSPLETREVQTLSGGERGAEKKRAFNCHESVTFPRSHETSRVSVCGRELVTKEKQLFARKNRISRISRQSDVYRTIFFPTS